ncbi:MAG TPA: hypothetical protein VKE51_01310 [Vicinamibacterales bacterium]|nr:hypothetical protein [Vicinamibacterales bacterium]
MTSKLADWRRLLRAHVTLARQLVRKLPADRVLFTPNVEPRRYTHRIASTLSRVFDGLI